MQECELYFHNIFWSEGCEGIGAQLECVPKLVGEEMNKTFTWMVDKEEVKRVAFQLRGNKALCHYGFPGIFYYRFWDILGDDVFYSIKVFFKTSTLIPNFCYTDIVLIPKILNLINTTHF